MFSGQSQGVCEFARTHKYSKSTMSYKLKGRKRRVLHTFVVVFCRQSEKKGAYYVRLVM